MAIERLFQLAGAVFIATVFLRCAPDRSSDSPGAVVDDLVANDVLKETQRPALIKYLRGRSSPSQVIRALTDVQLEKEHQHDVGGDLSADQGGKPNIVYCRELLEGLHASGIIKDETYRKYFPAVKSGHFIRPILLLRTLQHDVDYEQLMLPERLLPFADSLRVAGVVSAERHVALKKAITYGNITLRRHLLDYTEHGICLDLSNHPRDPRQYLPEVYTRIAALLPELAFTDFKVTIADDEIGATATAPLSVVVSFKAHNIVYQQTLELYVPSHGAFAHDGYLIPNNFYQIFNHVLIDTRSPYRLHRVPDEPDLATGSQNPYIGILALTQPQQWILSVPQGAFSVVASEAFTGKFTYTDIQQAIANLSKLGITAHLTQDQADSVLQHISMERPETIEQLLTYYPDIVYTFDYTFDRSEHPYSDFIVRLFHISHGAFHAENIRDEFSPKRSSFPLSFSIRGKPYTNRVVVDGHRADAKFPKFIFTVAEGLNLPGDFYDCVIHLKALSFIYLTPSQAKALETEYGVKLTKMP